MKLLFLKRLKRKVKVPGEIAEELITVKDIISPPSIEVSQSYFKLGEKLAKVYFIFSYPRYLSAAWLTPIINLSFPLDISFYLHPMESEKVLKQLRKKVTEIQADLIEREEKGLIRDPSLEIAYHDLEELRNRLQTAQERMFRFGLYITIYGDNEKELREIETTLRSILEARLVYIKPAYYQQKEGFISCSPYNLDQLFITTMLNTGTLASIFPFVSFDLSSNEGILYGINKHNLSLVLFDRFSLENANSCVFGVAGSGKSLDKNQVVLCKNKQGVQLLKIGALVEKLIKKHGATQIDDELEGIINPGIEVYSFDKNLKGEWSKVTVAARKRAPEIFYKFKTRSGREITTTGDHNMVVLKNGKVIVAKSSEIKKGEYIPLPRQVSSNQGHLKYLNLIELLRNSKKIFVYGAENLIKENYKVLKDKGISNIHNDYLVTYKRGVGIPIKFFWEIVKCLAINPDNERLRSLRITARYRKRGLNIYFPITDDFLKIAGFITSEGYIPEKYITIANTNKEVLDTLKSALKRMKLSFYEMRREAKGKRKESRTIVIQNIIFTEIVNSLKGGEKASRKKVWPFVFSLGKEQIAQYLSAYFEGDGCVDTKHLAVFAVSTSKRLISEIAYLLYYFGIVGRIQDVKRKREDDKRKKAWTIRISGQENLNKFAKDINFISERNKKKLSQIINRNASTNVDVIPGIEPIFKEIHSLFSPQLHNWRLFIDWKNGRRRPSQQKLSEIINIIENKIQYFRDLGATFKVLNELPSLGSIINLGKNNEGLNKELWQALGASWRIMKSQKYKPFSYNTLRAIKVINGNDYSLVELKEKVHLGFRELDLPTKYYNRALEPQYLLRRNIHYETLQKLAQLVWQNYQEVLNNRIPQVEEKLAQLKILANSDLFWDPIVKIKKIENKKEKYVYDLTVDNEVFLAGRGGMFVHNSYAIKLEILRYLMLGTECIIIDPENEYKFLSDAVGGSFINISLASPNHINPFDLPTPREDERPEDVLRSNIINLVGLLRIMLGGLTSEEDAIIDRALAETYAAKDITPETDPAYWGESIPIMSDLEEILSTMEGAESLVKRLQKFTRGVYAQFFNQLSNISMDNRLVVFGIRDMEDELRPMAMFIVLRYIWKTITSRLKKRILVVDEAWWLMKNEDSASFLFGTVKRCRKYWLGVTTITQDANDFMRSTYGQPIITNSALKILMKQSPATIDTVQKTFNLTDEEKLLLLETPVGEGIFFAGIKHVAIRMESSYAESQIITTAPEEVLKIKEAKKELTK